MCIEKKKKEKLYKFKFSAENKRVKTIKYYKN